MKKNIFKMVTAMVAVFMLASCRDETYDPQLSSVSDPAFTSANTNSSYVVTASNLTNTFETFVFTPAKYNVPVEVVSQLQMAKAGTDFASPVDLGASTSGTYVNVLYKDLNAALVSLGLSTSGTVYDVEVRVKSYVKSTSQTIVSYSKSTGFSATPYIAGPIYNYTDLYLIGNATAAEWSNTATNMGMYPLLKSSTDANVYTFTGYFKVGGFKILPEKGEWAHQYGYAAPGVLAKDDGNSSDIKVTAAGYYTLTVDISALTYSFVAATPSTTSYNKISIIGTVNGNWDTDTDLVKSSFDPHIWYTTATLKEGEFKFRADYDWKVNWGSKQEFFGTATASDNIPLTTGWTYHIYFNDITGDYTLIPVF